MGGLLAGHGRRLLLDEFEEEFNCKIEYDGSWPWFPKFVAGGVDNPPLDVTNWNLAEHDKTARAGDFFVSRKRSARTCPTARTCGRSRQKPAWASPRRLADTATPIRSDLVTRLPTTFKSFWEDRFAGKRGTYVAINSVAERLLHHVRPGLGQGRVRQGGRLQAVRRAMPLKLCDFTGNMQTLLERGEVEIAVLVDVEVYMQQ